MSYDTKEAVRQTLKERHYSRTCLGMLSMHKEDAIAVLRIALTSRPELISGVQSVLANAIGVDNDA